MGVGQDERAGGRGDHVPAQTGQRPDQVVAVAAGADDGQLGLDRRPVGGGGDHRGQRGAGHRPRRLLGRQPGDQPRVADDVAGPQPGQSPGLGERADHQQVVHRGVDLGLVLPGHGVHERLVDHHDASRPGQLAQRLAVVQDAGGVGRVADQQQVGVRQRIDVQGERRGQDVAPGRTSRGEQRRLRLGELRMHHHRPVAGDGPGDQRERLRPARGGQHHLRRDTVERRDRGAGRGRVRVGAEAGQGRGDRRQHPVRRAGETYVDRQVDQTLGHLGVAVVIEVGARGGVRVRGVAELLGQLRGAGPVHVQVGGGSAGVVVVRWNSWPWVPSASR
ncbi:hypothetical protein SDC9_125482 [bioreactor metagenome]|uniref:Uncharacterized protein n=1 Tax=bioreactor metagenome TaxID=1076179 RepID=A0A645CNG2_9ZZZZ